MPAIPRRLASVIGRRLPSRSSRGVAPTLSSWGAAAPKDLRVTGNRRFFAACGPLRMTSMGRPLRMTG